LRNALHYSCSNNCFLSLTLQAILGETPVNL
jgi:hypothetical protein